MRRIKQKSEKKVKYSFLKDFRHPDLQYGKKECIVMR